MSAPTRLIVAQRPSEPLEPVCARLVESGCELYTCTSHAQALAALRQEVVEIVLIDAWIEGGMALLTQIKSEPALRHLPVSFVSLYAYINPVIAVTLGVLLLGETFDARMTTAAVLVFAGVAIVRMRRASTAVELQPKDRKQVA